MQRIFAIEGFLIGIAGVGFGLGMGLVITKNLDRIQTVVERVAGFDVLPANVYQLQHLPSQIVPGELLLIAAIAMVLSIGALETSWLHTGVVTRIRKRAFWSGSSKQGKKRRASVASSWVKA